MNKSASVQKSSKTPEIRIAKSVFRKRVSKQIFSIFGYLILTAAVIYLCFAATIIRVIPSSTDMGWEPVRNLTFAGGVAPSGAQLVVSTTSEQGDSFGDRLLQSLLISSTAAKVEVIAGPFGKINWTESGIVTVDGKPTGVLLFEQPSGEYLNSEYLVKCISGACNPGEGLIISSKNIYGEPLNKS